MPDVSVGTPRPMSATNPFATSVASGGTTASPRLFNPMDTQFGAVGDGVTDDTAAFTACWTAALAAGGPALIYVPAALSEYLITAALPPILNTHPIYIVGDGEQVSVIRWNPIAGGQACITIQPAPATTLVNDAHIRGIGIKSSNAVTKTGLRLIATSASHYDHLYIQLLHAGDTALELQGYDTSSVSNFFFAATFPIRCNKITIGTATGQGPLDHWNFHNGTLFSFDDAQPLVSFEAGASMTNCSFTGFQSWLGGSDGLVFHSANFFTDNHFENIRWENSAAQLAAGTLHGFMFDIAPSLGLFNKFEHLRGGGVGQQGFKFRTMDYITMDSIFFDGGPLGVPFVQVDADDTCNHISMTNVHFGDFVNATRTLGTALKRIFASAGDAFTGGAWYPTAYYEQQPSAGINFAAATVFGQPVYKATTAAAGAQVDLAPAASLSLPSPGTMFAAGNGCCRVFVLATRADLGDGTQERGYFSTTWWGVTLDFGSANVAASDVAGKLSLIYNGATGTMTLKNNMAVTLRVKVNID